jgi:threonine dehydrogenase-like Zn-dependent dehydrogenase
MPVRKFHPANIQAVVRIVHVGNQRCAYSAAAGFGMMIAGKPRRPAFMKAAFRKDSDVMVRDVPVRQILPHEIRLRVTACGICGTDLHWNSKPAKDSPFGHEVAGTVLEVGAAVSNVKVGQAIALESSSACGQCDACRNMRQELCPNLRVFWGAGPALGFAEEMLTPAQCAVPYDGLAPEVACLSEPLGVAIDVLRLSEVGIDSNVLVMGAGPIGLMIAQLVKRRGARRLFVADMKKQTRRLAVARQFGADDVVTVDETPISKFAYGCPIDRILVTAPPPALAETFDLAAKGGIVTFIGLGEGDKAMCSFDANKFHFKKLQLRASFAAPAMFTPLALRYLKEGVIDGEALISHRFPLADIAKAVRTANEADAVKVVVMP